jgi:hypothetical protein
MGAVAVLGMSLNALARAADNIMAESSAAAQLRRVVPIGGTQVEVNNRSDSKGEQR